LQLKKKINPALGGSNAIYVVMNKLATIFNIRPVKLGFLICSKWL